MNMPNAAAYLKPGCAHASDALCDYGLTSATGEHRGFLMVRDRFYTRKKGGLFSLERTDKIQLRVGKEEPSFSR